MLVYQRLKHHQFPLNRHFSMVFLWFSYGFPIYPCLSWLIHPIPWESKHNGCIEWLSKGSLHPTQDWQKYVKHFYHVIYPISDPDLCSLWLLLYIECICISIYIYIYIYTLYHSIYVPYYHLSYLHACISLSSYCYHILITSMNIVEHVRTVLYRPYHATCVCFQYPFTVYSLRCNGFGK